MTSTFTSNLTNNINNTLTSEFNNFVFDFSSETYNPLDPYIHNLISFLISLDLSSKVRWSCNDSVCFKSS